MIIENVQIEEKKNTSKYNGAQSSDQGDKTLKKNHDAKRNDGSSGRSLNIALLNYTLTYKNELNKWLSNEGNHWKHKANEKLFMQGDRVLATTRSRTWQIQLHGLVFKVKNMRKVV